MSKKVIFTQSSPEQVKWGMNDDPEGILVQGQEYTVAREESHGWHTKLILEEFPGKKFNSTSFEEVHPELDAPPEAAVASSNPGMSQS